ncbi:MAPEG family protein [Sulfitobacter sp. MF3-043]|uniref:MAPEG family protein n=1 Tax=Sulfitobacter sediminivivens TaxID=3252902 RepID=UPI0036D947AB
MNKRPTIVIGMVAGLIWAFAVIGGAMRLNMPFVPAPVALLGAFFPGGLVTCAMIGRLAQRRFFDDESIDGQGFAPGSAASIDQKVLTNTIEQMVLALAIWPFVALTLGGQVIIAMGLAFAVARVLFWVGYHMSPPLRGFGFAATFYTTCIAAFWSLVVWAF